MKRSLCLSLLFAFLASCTGGISKPVSSASDVRVIRDVPFYTDTNYQCGPSSLASVINYWYAKTQAASRISPAIISAEIYSRGARGTLGMDIELYAKKTGFQTTQYSGNIDDLKHNIVREVPLIVLVDYGMFFYQRNHFMVVTGYSGDGIIVHSGSEEKIVPYAEFEKIWRKTRFWTLVIRPSD
jgi:predicted double-glycine peptidase